MATLATSNSANPATALASQLAVANGPGGLPWPGQEETALDVVDPSVDPGQTFLDFKFAVGAGPVSDDQAMANAIATLGPSGKTLIINAGVTIHLTKTVQLPYSMQVVSASPSSVHSNLIESSAAGGAFIITAPNRVLLQGLNISDDASTGSAVVMQGDNTILRDDTFTNASGNSSTMVRFAGYNQSVQDCTFVNNEKTAYCWDAISNGGWAGYGGTNINDSLVGGSASGIGKGGRIENVGSPSGFTGEGFTIAGWSCSTQGTQVEANDIYALFIENSVFSGSTESAIVVGGGDSLRGALGVTIDHSSISAAGTAIDASPAFGSGANYVTIENSTISNSATGIAANSETGRLSILANVFSNDGTVVNLVDPQADTVLVANSVSGGTVAVSMATPNSSVAAALNAFAPSVVFTGLAGSQLGATTIGDGAIPALSATTQPTSVSDTMVPAQGETFLDFKYSGNGTVLSDDQAMADAIATLGPSHRTLVINDGITINLTHTVEVTHSMTIESASVGLDASSRIVMTGGQDLMHIDADGPVIVQGLSLQGGAAGSLITTGDGKTVVRNCELTNVAGNASPMVVLQGADQLLEDDYFTNNEADAYCWDAAYSKTPSSTAPDVISGGWAYGIGKGGLVGDHQAIAKVGTFDIDDWTAVLTGTVQVDAQNVDTLNVQGGVFDWSSKNAFLLGDGNSGQQNVSISDAYISTASAAASGTAIALAPASGGGATSLSVSGNTINCAGTAIAADGLTGSLAITGNSIFNVGEGLAITDTSGPVYVVGNQVDAGLALVASSVGMTGQNYIGNSFNGQLLVDRNLAISGKFVGNVGSADFVDANGTPLQADAVSAQTTPLQIAGMRAELFAGLTSAQLTALTPAQLAAVSAPQFAALSPLQLNALSASQVQAIAASDLAGLTSGQIAALSGAFVGSLTAAQRAVIRTGAVNAGVSDPAGGSNPAVAATTGSTGGSAASNASGVTTSGNQATVSVSGSNPPVATTTGSTGGSAASNASGVTTSGNQATVSVSGSNPPVATTIGSTGNSTSAVNAGVIVSNGSDTVSSGTKTSTVLLKGSGATIVGGVGALTVNGGSGSGNTVYSGTGGLVYTGGSGGPDVVFGGGNRVIATGGTGGAEFFGGGNAVLTAGAGGALNLEIGGNGDQLYAVGSAGVLFGTVGGDMLMSSLNDTGNSVFFGATGSGRMTFITGAGDDLLALGQGIDTVTLGAGHDTIFGNGGTTSVSTINAGTGSLDLAFSGASTMLNITAGNARDFNLYGYGTGIDTIHLQGYAALQAANALSTQRQIGGNTLLSLSDGSSIALMGVSHATASLFA